MRRTMALGLLLAVPAEAAETLSPGEWESAHRIESMVMPGVPEAAAASMKGKVISASQCITAADLEKPQEKLFKSSDGRCRYTSFDMSRGAIKATSLCAGNPELQGTVTGSYTATSFTMRTTMAGSNGMQMVMASSGRRIGACK